MGIWNDRKLIVNCLPLTESERAQFIRAAKDMPQEFVGDSAQRGSMSWTAAVPEELKAKATAVIGNIAPEECAQCPKLEWLQTWSAGVDKYQRPGILQPGSMLTNATGAYGQSVSEHMFTMMWAIMKNLHICAASNTNATWQDAGRAITPDGKTALMIGTGDIGSHFARLCKALPVSSTTSVCCSSTTRRFVLQPRGLIGTACELLSAAVFAGFGSWGLVPCLGQVRSPRTFLIRTVITPAPARSDVRTGDYNVIRRFLSTGSIRRTSSSRSRFKSA